VLGIVRLIVPLLNRCPHVHAMRDVTRGGLATVLNEFAASANVGICLDEAAIPVLEEVKGVCEILGFDPLYLANEGKLAVVVKREDVDTGLQCLGKFPSQLKYNYNK
jgi:hydrogenase expression/formation protein HypE